jgi:hypothetical protein
MKPQNNVMTYLLLQKYTKIVPAEMEQELWHCAYWWFVKLGLLREELESSSNPRKANLKCSKSVHVRYYEIELYLTAVCDS